MKIGIDIRNIGKKRTGDEVVFLNLVKNLARIDGKNNYFLFTNISDKKNIARIKKELEIENKENFKIISLPVNRFLWNFWTLSKYLRKNPVNVYHTQYITPWFVPKNIKITTTIHDISFNFFPQFIKPTDLFFLRILIPISLKRADKIIAVSEFTKNEIIKYYKINPEKIECVYNSIDDKFLSEEVSEEKLKEVKIKYNLPEKFVLYVGTLQPRKNIPQLMEAFFRIKARLENFKLVICGNREAHNFDKKINDLMQLNDFKTYIIFPGFIKEADKNAVYKLARAFVFPSFYEGFGIPILEALACQTPVLASEIAPHKEIAREGALFFKLNDPDDLDKKLENICLNDVLRERLIKKGNEQVKKFSWQESAKKMLDIFNKLK